MTADKCKYCGKTGVPLHRDHVVPRSRGGPDNARNIVMACQSCNSSKGDLLASEWLGERCPPDVLRIEAAVNERIRKSFKHRGKIGKPKQAKLFAFTTDERGVVEYLGEVVSESESTIRLEVIDGLLSWAGFWQLSGEVIDAPRSRCRLFRDKQQCYEKAMDINDRHPALRHLNQTGV